MSRCDECADCARFSRADREATIHRIFDGTPKIAIAEELNIHKRCLIDWETDWNRREGQWEGRPLTPAERARGWRIGSYDVKRPGATKAAKKSIGINRFLMKLAKGESMDRAEIESSYQKLDDVTRAMLAPAFDTALESIDHAEQAEKMRALALNLAAEVFTAREPAQEAA
jgi:hypothetical protein